MIKIKLSTQFPNWPLIRQTPGSKGIWENCQFFVNQDNEECDYWFVCGGLLKPEKAVCPPENTIFISWEPPSVQKYDQNFLQQFATVITCHRNIQHPHVIYMQQGLPWHVGRHLRTDANIVFSKDYDELKAIKSFDKHKLISVISSSKDFTEGHKRRLEFIKKLSEYFGERLDSFGREIREIEDKWDAISDYKYHIVIENNYFPDYWTEKLSDAFLGGSYPFYYGCSNISDYFPKGSFTWIDIDDVEKAILTIEDAIKNEQYEKSVDKIEEARKLILDKYNLFSMICDYCNKNTSISLPRRITLNPESMFTKYSNVLYKTVKKIKTLFLKNKE